MTKQEWYNTLELPSGSCKDKVKAAYRRLASKHHPDKGGDVKKFQEIQAAYDNLYKVAPDVRISVEGSFWHQQKVIEEYELDVTKFKNEIQRLRDNNDALNECVNYHRNVESNITTRNIQKMWLTLSYGGTIGFIVSFIIFKLF
jgi:hypothetical protein